MTVSLRVQVRFHVIPNQNKMVLDATVMVDKPHLFRTLPSMYQLGSAKLIVKRNAPVHS